MHMEERHRLLLIKQNPQWTSEPIETPGFERFLLHVTEKYLKYKQILAIVGLRRVGKTVLLKQLMKKLNTDKSNICYISFDDRDFQKYETAYYLIEYFLQNSDREQIRYLFLDEIQKVPNWQDLLKTLYDIEKNLKIIISGSSSLELKQYKETLAGRIITFHMSILTFREFVCYNKLESEINYENLFRDYDLKFLNRKNLYENLFNKYVIKGAFPELLEIDDEEFIKKYILEVIDKVIADISKNIEPQKEGEISNLILLFCKSTARIFELNNLASTLKINRNTASRYVQILEKTFLIKTSFNYTKSIAKKLRIGKKGYIAHSSISIAALNYPHEIVNIEGSDFGHLVETVVVSNLDDFCFWRHQNYEVDILLKDKKPVEIKYQNQINISDAKAVVKCMEALKVKRGIVVTKSLLDKKTEGDNEILFIPAWLFLLIKEFMLK